MEKKLREEEAFRKTHLLVNEMMQPASLKDVEGMAKKDMKRQLKEEFGFSPSFFASKTAVAKCLVAHANRKFRTSVLERTTMSQFVSRLGINEIHGIMRNDFDVDIDSLQFSLDSKATVKIFIATLRSDSDSREEFMQRMRSEHLRHIEGKFQRELKN